MKFKKLITITALSMMMATAFAAVASQKNCEKKPLKLRKLNHKIFSLF